MADPHCQSPAKVKELAAACGFRPGHSQVSGVAFSADFS
jgi:hypothetical protein